MKFFISGFVLSLVLVSAFAENEVNYPEPDFNAPLFDASEVTFEPEVTDSLKSSLLSLARAAGVDPIVRAKALAFLHTIDPKNEEAIFLNFLLHNGFQYYSPRSAEQTPLLEASDTQKLASVLKELSIRLSLEGDSYDPAAHCLADIAANLESPPRSESKAAAIWANAIPVQTPASRPSKPVGPGRFVKSDASLKGLYMLSSLDEATKVQRAWNNRDPKEYYAAMERAYTQQFRAAPVKATAIPNSSDFGFQLSGPDVLDLHRAVREANKMFSVLAKPVPNKGTVKLEFGTNIYSRFNGPSAALMAALLLDSLATGDAFDPNYAPLGDLSADGTVQAIADIAPRIMAGAKDPQLSHVAIPKDNLVDLADMLLLGGTDELYKVQVFTVETYQEARELALSKEKRPENLQSAINEFEKIQLFLDLGTSDQIKLNEEVSKRLRAVLELAPNHASARLLLLRLLDRHPKTLSIAGSFRYIYEHEDDRSSLLAMRNRLHATTHDWVHALINNPAQADLEWENLMNNPTAREVLMRQSRLGL